MLYALLLFALSGPAGDPSQQARIKRLEEMLLAPCCYSEPVSRHQSEVARKMRVEISDWVAQGRSDRQILGSYKQIYGPRVLIEPEGALRWWIYVVPALATVVGLALTLALLRKWLSNANTLHPTG